jgi:hypothetical protein
LLEELAQRGGGGALAEDWMKPVKLETMHL